MSTTIRPLLFLLHLLLITPGIAQQAAASSRDSAAKALKRHSLSVAFRTPDLRNFTIPGTSENIVPQHSKLVLCYTYALSDRHLLSAEAGWSRTRAFPLYEPTGALNQYTSAFIPELRLGYRYQFGRPDRPVRPYLGMGTVLSTHLTPVAGQRVSGGLMEFQTMAGLRIFPEGGPISIQVEVPFTFMTVARTSFVDGSSRTAGRFSRPGTLEGALGQFWPLVGIGWRW